LTPAILLINTTSSPGGVALARGQQLLAERRFSSQRRQAEQIFPLLRELLGEAKLELRDVDAIAVLTGPGAFTSIRVGLTAAKGLAEALGKPLIGASGMEVLALRATSFPAVLVLPASRGDLFLGIVEAAGPAEPRISPLDVVPGDCWQASLGFVPRCVVSPDRDLLESLGWKPADGTDPVLAPSNWMEIFAEFARKRWSSQRFEDPLSLDAAYVRKNDADLSWTDHRLDAGLNS
jgi:tRNA threonylcarbamoyladenosine biosynthesis protein TsaB